MMPQQSVYYVPAEEPGPVYVPQQLSITWDYNNIMMAIVWTALVGVWVKMAIDFFRSQGDKGEED